MQILKFKYSVVDICLKLLSKNILQSKFQNKKSYVFMYGI